MKECLICKRVFGDHSERCDRDRSPLKSTLPGLPIIAERYRLEERIGHGSVATVYRGVYIENGAVVVIKIISPEFVQADANLVVAFFDEISALINIEHPNIARVFDYGKSLDGYLYLVMEYLQGYTLKTLIEQDPEIPFDRVISLTSQICDAVASMHKHGRLHRDLKPCNIFVVYGEDNRELIKVADFGIARIKSLELCRSLPGAVTQSLLEIPYYWSPEQCAGEEIDARSEVYSLGVIFYQMLTGRLPFYGTHVSVLEQHLEQIPAPPRSLRKDIPEALETIALRALAKSAKERFPSPTALLMLLKMAMMSYGSNVSLGRDNIKVGAQSDSLRNIERTRAVVNSPARLKGGHTRQLGKEYLDSLEALLIDKLKDSLHLTLADLQPKDIINQLASQFREKNIWQEGENFIPHLVKVFIPAAHREKFVELEAIFNSISFVNHLYKYVAECGYKLMGLLEVKIEQQATTIGGCVILLEWPNPIDNRVEDAPSLDLLAQPMLSLMDISLAALLQSINAAAYCEQYLVIKPVTYIGRFYNVFDPHTGDLLRRNDLAFLPSPEQDNVANSSISRQHAKIEMVDNNFYLFDTGSSNGTVINRCYPSRQQIVVKAEQGVILHDRDIIQLGLALLSFEIIRDRERIETLIEQHSGRKLTFTEGSMAEIYRTAGIANLLNNTASW